MASYLKESAQRLWKIDVDAYYRWKNFLERFPNLRQQDRERVEGYMKKIQERWPNHPME